MIASPFRMTAMLVAASLGVSSTAGFAQTSCQAGGQGCVLPLRAPPVAQLPPLPEAPVVSAPIEAPLAVAGVRSAGFSPFLLIALAAVAALAAYLLLNGNNDDEAPASP